MKTTTTALIFLASIAQVALSKPVSHPMPNPIAFTPEDWTQDNAHELFEYTNNVIKAQRGFIRAIEGVVKSVAKHNQLVFQSRPQPKTEQRFTAKFNESLGIYSKSSGQEDFAPMKQWLGFSGVFGDFAAVRVTPHNGGVITDTKAIIQEISDRMKQKLPDLGFTADETWNSTIGRENTMSRLFINLTPNAEFLKDVRVTMEIQVIHTVETAIAFTANSVAGHTNTDVGFPKMTKIKSSALTKKNKKTGEDDPISLMDYMTTKDAAHVKDFPAALKENGFEVPDAFLEFYKQQKKKYNKSFFSHFKWW